MEQTQLDKPAGCKNYGSIGHLPGSRRGPGDHGINEGQERICTLKPRDKHDSIIVQEKLDGSNVGVLRDGDNIIPLQRAGFRAVASPYLQHRLFHNWAWERRGQFLEVLEPGERLVGEWLAMAHGTRYDLTGRPPFVAFDIMTGTTRLPFVSFCERINCKFATPPLLGRGAMTIEAALEKLGENGFYGAIDQAEGCVWRIERKGKVDFLAKYVRPNKVDGKYFPNISGTSEVWNWTPPLAETA